LVFLGNWTHLIFAIWICVIPGTAIGGANTFFLNGSTLLQLCTSQSLEEQAACEGYILGVQDSVFSGHLSDYVDICYPNGVGTRQLRLQFIQHANANPAKLHFAAEGLVAESVAMIFSCPIEQAAPEQQPVIMPLDSRPLPKSLPKPSPVRCPFWPQLTCGWTPD
jgi:hypothetical protein